MLHAVALFEQFGVGGVHAGAREVVDLDALYDGVRAVGAGDGEAVDHTFGNAVGAVAGDAHGYPVAGGCAQSPVADVLDGGVGCRGCRGKTASFDDGGAALGNRGDERVNVPRFVVDRWPYLRPICFQHGDVGVLGDGVVAPDDHLGEGRGVQTRLGRDLRQGTVVVKAHQGRDVARVQVGGAHGRDKGIRVGGVADDDDLDVAVGNGVQGLALDGKDLSIGFQQVLALHALRTGASTNQQGIVGILEGYHRVVRADDAVQQREGTIVKLHGHAAKSLHALRQVQQLKDHRLIGSEHGATGDAEHKTIADLAGSAGDGNANRCF